MSAGFRVNVCRPVITPVTADGVGVRAEAAPAAAIRRPNDATVIPAALTPLRIRMVTPYVVAADPNIHSNRISAHSYRPSPLAQLKPAPSPGWGYMCSMSLKFLAPDGQVWPQAPIMSYRSDVCESNQPNSPG